MLRGLEVDGIDKPRGDDRPTLPPTNLIQGTESGKHEVANMIQRPTKMI